MAELEERQAKNLLLFEFMFADVVDDYNQANKSTPIMASEARVMRERIDAYMHENFGVDGLADCKRVSQCEEAINAVIAERIGEAPYNPEAKSEDELYKSQLSRFVAMTQFKNPEYGFVPLSPYDPRICDREAARLSGTRFMTVPTKELGNFTELGNPEFDKTIEVQYGVRFDDDGKPHGQSKYMFTEIDACGLAPLLRYMTQKEFEDVRPWMAQTVDMSNLTQEQLNSYKIASRRSMAVLEGLVSHGDTFKIVRDREPGQIKAVIDGTRLNVRVTDKPEAAHYIGLVYDNGVNVRYSTTRRAKKENNTTYTVAFEPTPEDCYNLVRIAKGEAVPRINEPGFIGNTGVYDLKVGKNTRKNNMSYHGSNGVFTAVAGRYVDPKTGKPDVFGNRITVLTDTKRRSEATTAMPTQKEAALYLANAFVSARNNLLSEIDAERIIAEYKMNMEDADYTPEFSGDVEIAAIQQGYWAILRGEKTTLMQPGEAADEYEQNLDNGEIDELDASVLTYGELKNGVTDVGMTAENMILQHANDMCDYMVGPDYVSSVLPVIENMDETQVSKFLRDSHFEFNPVGLSRYMDSPYGVFRNNADIIKAMRMCDMNGSEFLGDNFYIDSMASKLISFDETKAYPMSRSENEFLQNMYSVITESLSVNGISFDENDILFDPTTNIVRYTGNMDSKQAGGSETTRVVGEIGQIFVPNSHGIVYTNFYGMKTDDSNNFALIPGYEATILPNKPGESKTVEERTRLIGYEQKMANAIRYQIRQDTIGGPRGEVLGDPTSVNDVYRGLYGERYSSDFMLRYLEQGMPEDVLMAIIETQASRVRYSNDIRDGSTINADYRATQTNVDVDKGNDNFNDAYVLTGGRNMSILTEEGDGYFDPIATTATSTNQGILRFLTTDATVNLDGSITPGAKDGQCAIMKHDICKYMKYNPFDRQCMTISNLIQASAITEPVNVAQMTFGGWNQDDPVVVSKAFADKYQMRNHDGSLRSLMIGDKLSDMNGNKGVVSLIVDPDMSEEEAKAQGIEEQVAWFKANPELDIVMAPFPAVSRFNGGTAREMMESPSDLVSPTGEVVPGGIGKLRMIVTDKAADTKTHIYDDEELAAGRGRKVSAQLAWGLNSKGADAIMRECYSRNSGVAANLREYMVVCGMDMSETGELGIGYTPQESNERRVFEIPHVTRAGGDGVSRIEAREMFGREISESGGFLNIPFPLKYPTGGYTQPFDENGIVSGDALLQYGSIDEGSHAFVPNKEKSADVSGWALPIMSSHLRSGQTFEDGTNIVHDYTNHYLAIFNSAVSYNMARETIEGYKDGSVELPANTSLEDAIAAKEATMADSQLRAQRSFDSITGQVSHQVFEGKHNIFRDSVMSRRMPNSATAVWSADPRLDIDQVAVGSKMAETLGVKDNDYVLLWRDPVLRSSGIRYMRVKVDENIHGVAISPVMDKPFDGDFDGDTVGVLKLHTHEARKQAYNLFSVDSNLIETGDGKYGLTSHVSLDIKVAEYEEAKALAEKYPDGVPDDVKAETLEASFAAINDRILNFERNHDANILSDNEVRKLRSEAVSDLSDLYRRAYANQCGNAVIRYDSPESHVKSIWEACIDTGAKGSPKKVVDYLEYLGIDAPGIAGGPDCVSEYSDCGDTKATRQMQQDTMYACAVKSFGTGVAGRYSQRGVEACRNSCITPVLEVTYPVTQGILQAKHDRLDAIRRYSMIMSPVRELWRGHSLSLNETRDGWTLNREEDGSPKRATKDEWVSTFMEMYSGDSAASLGVDVNEKYVREIADTLADKDGRMLNIEADSIDGASVMDKLAYEPSFANVFQAAIEGKNLYEGKFNSMFAPSNITKNVEAKELLENVEFIDGMEDVAPKVTPIVKKDVSADYVAKPKVGTPIAAKSNSKSEPDFEF